LSRVSRPNRGCVARKGKTNANESSYKGFYKKMRTINFKLGAGATSENAFCAAVSFNELGDSYKGFRDLVPYDFVDIVHFEALRFKVVER